MGYLHTSRLHCLALGTRIRSYLNFRSVLPIDIRLSVELCISLRETAGLPFTLGGSPAWLVEPRLMDVEPRGSYSRATARQSAIGYPQSLGYRFAETGKDEEKNLDAWEEGEGETRGRDGNGSVHRLGRFETAGQDGRPGYS
ncbi:hypothetical protein NMY22_g7551 [Coprinellus aureogranulatus]|nr:hypothetical protein NMY22_g7551 [Coprinellus aureogranulatus]